MSISTCTLRRCQGKRGCICPKGFLAVGTYSGNHSKKESKEVNLPSMSHKANISSESHIDHNILKNSAKASPKTRKNLLSDIDQKANDNKLDRVDEKKSSTDEPILNQLLISPMSDADLSKINNDEKIFAKANSQNVNDGFITVKYNHYSKQFPIVNGSTTATSIDSEFSLTFAFPNSRIHLTTRAPNIFTYEDPAVTSIPLVQEDPVGTYQGLLVNDVYWVYIEEDIEDKKAYEERQEKFAREQARKREEDEKDNENGINTIKTDKVESCSCIEGNPCLDRYSCKDWNNRYTIAKKYGWKGF